MNYFFNPKQQRVFFTFLLMLIFSSCGGENSVPNDVKSPIDTGDINLSGKIIDGEISGATVFLDLNRNNLLDIGEPTTKSDGNGSFILTLTDRQKKHTNYLNKIAPIVIYGGVDIRTDKVFEDYLTAIREYNGSINVTPLSTLISETLGLFLDNDVNNSFNTVDDKINEIKEHLAVLLHIKKELLTKDPIEVAKRGDIRLINISLQLHKIAKNMKKAMNKKLQKLESSILKSYQAMGKNFEKLKTSDIKNDTTALERVLEDVFEDNTIFDNNFTKSVKAESKLLSKDIQDFWKKNNIMLSDTMITKALNDIEIITVDINDSSTSTNTEIDNNSNTPTRDTISSYYIAVDNTFSKVKKSFKNFTVVVYTDRLLSDKPSNSTKAIYGNINGENTKALLKINDYYSDGDTFIIKIFKGSTLIGESSKSILKGNILKFSDIITK